MSLAAICGRCALAIVLFLLASPRLVAQQAPGPPNVDSDQTLMQNYYRNPQPARLIGFLDRYRDHAKGWQSFPPAVGFFAVVFNAHPEWVERLVPSRLDGGLAETVDAALQLSGQATLKARWQPRLAQSRSDARLQAELAGLPSRLQDLQITTPSHLDLLWGAFFASGDQRHVRMIVDLLARTADRSPDVALDVMRTVAAHTGGPKEPLAKMKEKYDQAVLWEIIRAGSAAWSLGANARQHERVAKTIMTYIAEHSGTPTAMLLQALLPRGQQ